jgi:hypothetical protein
MNIIQICKTKLQLQALTMEEYSRSQDGEILMANMNQTYLIS